MKRSGFLVVLVSVICTSAIAAAGSLDSRGAIRVVAEDRDGVTLHLPALAYAHHADEFGRVGLRIPGYGQIREAGRPVLPRITALVAIPLDSTPSLEILEDPRRSVMSPVLDRWTPSTKGEPDWLVGRPHESVGSWPPAPARIAWVGRLRGRDVALVELFPVRASEDGTTLSISSGLTARVRFEPAPSDDRPAIADDSPFGDRWFGDVAASAVVNPRTLAPFSVRDDSGGSLPASGPEESGSPSTDGTAITPVKVRVTADGVYGITGAALQAAGVDLTGVDPRELKLSNRGLPVAVVLEGESDGVFDAADTLVFVGESIDTRTTGVNVYRLETDAPNAIRIETRDATPGGAPLVGVHRDVVRREESHLYTGNSPPAQPTEHWWWERLDTPAGTYPSMSDVYRVTLNHLPASAAQARLRFNVQGRSRQFPQPDHRTVLHVNGTIVDDQEWIDIESFTHDVLFDASLLVEGENVVTLEQRQQPGVVFASLYSNWFSLEYDDSLIAEGDALRFSLAAGPFTAEVEGFGQSAIDLFDVSDPATPVALSGVEIVSGAGGWTVRFQDAPAGQADYVAASPAGRLVPASIAPDEPSDLRSTANGADLIVITHPDFDAAVQPLVDRRVAEGLRVVKVLVEDVMDEFADGLYEPDAIREFVEYAYFNWQAPAPAYLLLFGDASLDYRDYYGAGNDYVPAKLTANLPGIGEVMTDNFYGRVDGNDLLPDVYVGRITVRTTAEAQAAVDKIVAYSTNPPAATVGNAVLLVADDGLTTYDPDFEGISELLAEAVPSAMTTHRVYAHDFPDNAAIRAEITNRINSGALITNYLGHGNQTIWGSRNGSGGNFFDSSGVQTLANGADLTFAIALNCVNGYFADFTTPYTTGEEWLRSTDRGGIGGFTPSGLGFLGDYDVLSREIFRRVFQEHDSLVGSFVIRSLIRAYVEFGIDADNMDELILFGDPSMHLASDVDRDTLLDREEIAAGTDAGDADGDDDGLTDDEEPSWNADPDGDGSVNAIDPDSDDDGLPDGLEAGRTFPSIATDTSRGHFVADADPATTTNTQVADTDGGGAPDGAEDRNVNGLVDIGETDPNVSGDDPECAPSAPIEITGVRVAKDGDDVVLTWDDLVPGDPCLLYRVYVATNPPTPAAPDDFSRVATVPAPSYRHRGALLAPDRRDYRVTAISPTTGEGP